MDILSPIMPQKMEKLSTFNKKSFLCTSQIFLNKKTLLGESMFKLYQALFNWTIHGLLED